MKAKIPIKFRRNFQSINFVFHRRFSMDFRKEFHVNFNMILHRKFIISCWISYEISHEIYFYTELDIKDTFVRNFTFHRKFRMTYYWKCHMTKSPGASQGMVSDNTATIWRPGPRFNIKTVFFRYGDTHIIFNIVIPILVRRHLYIETASWILRSVCLFHGLLSKPSAILCPKFFCLSRILNMSCHSYHTTKHVW